MNEKRGYVYILANTKNSVLYIGVTSNLAKRIYEHKTHAVEGFSDKYNTEKLVYFEIHDRIEDAIFREKQLKKWSRKKKVALIEAENPLWEDLLSA